MQKEEDYTVTLNSETVTIICTGVLDMQGKERYKNIKELFHNVISTHPDPETVTLDIRKLEFINSSGLAVIGEFIMTLKRKRIGLFIRCAEQYGWQARSMKAIGKLMPKEAKISFE